VTTFEVAPTTAVTLVASFVQAHAARRAAASVRGLGLPDDAVSVIGGEAPPSWTYDPANRERSLIWRIFWAGLIWGGVGAVVGALAGLGVALAGFPTSNMGIQVASWAMFVHIAATLWAAYAVIDQRGDTERREPRRDGRALVSVRVADAAMLSRVEEALRGSGATAIGRG